MALSVSAALLANRKHARDQEEESETSNEASIEASLRNLSRPRIRGVRGVRRARSVRGVRGFNQRRWVVRPSRGGLVLHGVRNTRECPIVCVWGRGL